MILREDFYRAVNSYKYHSFILKCNSILNSNDLRGYGVMTISLIDVLFRSEKRKRVLLLLKDGTKQMEDILKSLGTTRQALLPQIKILEKHNLLSKSNDSYELTIIGKLIVDDMALLVDTTKVLDIDIYYWGSHKLDCIPPHLLKRINELGSFKTRLPPIENSNEINKMIVETTEKSESMISISSFAYPNFLEILENFTAKGVELTIIVSKELDENLRHNKYYDFKRLLENKKIKIFVYPLKIDFISFTQNDYCSFLRLLTKEGAFDNSQLIFCNPGSLTWGKEFFEYYLKDSIQRTVI